MGVKIQNLLLVCGFMWVSKTKHKKQTRLKWVRCFLPVCQTNITRVKSTLTRVCKLHDCPISLLQVVTVAQTITCWKEALLRCLTICDSYTRERWQAHWAAYSKRGDICVCLSNLWYTKSPFHTERANLIKKSSLYFIEIWETLHDIIGMNSKWKSIATVNTG